MDISYEDVVKHKYLTTKEREDDLAKLKAWKGDDNERKFCGNAYLYHYQLENLLNTRVGKHPLLKEMFADETMKAKMITDVLKRDRTGTFPNRVFEAYRVNKGAVVFFKPSTAKFLYKKYSATSVLDFTAGWGGRMLGAWALGIGYTGIDTNVEMKTAYECMMNELGGDLQMIWKSCLDVDFTELDYDFVLTSPPYINLELYSNMTPFASKQAFYTEFLIPMIDKCRKYIKRNGKTAINISPQMYANLLKAGYSPCDEEFNLLQQKRAGKDKQDKIYVWNASSIF